METEHIVKGYEEDLGRLDHMIAEMGGLVEAQLAEAIDTLVKRDADRAMTIVEKDKQIDTLESEIDAFTIKLLAFRQPMAEDLRQIITALKVSSNLERIGDYAKNVAKRTVTLAKAPSMGDSTASLARMATMVQSMINNVLDAYIARDSDLADDVRMRDAEVDHLHSSLFRELLTYMMEEPRNITACTHLLFVAKNIERMGDHVTSIAEQVHFLAQGEIPEDDRPKGDSSAFTLVEPK